MTNAEKIVFAIIGFAILYQLLEIKKVLMMTSGLL